MVATAAAVASKKLKRPVKLSLDINTNMEMVGKRHPFRCDYKVGFDDNGNGNPSPRFFRNSLTPTRHTPRTTRTPHTPRTHTTHNTQARSMPCR
jgi:CO/xanthine dehydrogenase Mo-binding subunit